MTEQRRKLLKARIALALKAEWGRVPTNTEIERYSALASILFTSIGGAMIMRQKQKQNKQLQLWS